MFQSIRYIFIVNLLCVVHLCNYIDIYLVVVKFDSVGLKSKAHLFGLLHGGSGRFSFFLQDHPSKLFRDFIGFGSVIHVSA